MLRPRPSQPGPGQESVWDYPRPPRLERTERRIRAVLRDITIADSTRAFRVLETSHPPVYYLPPDDVRTGILVAGSGTSFCEWKGSAVYHDAVIEGERIARVAWSYPTPNRTFDSIQGYLAFYLPAIDAGFVDDERAQPQPGGFYGGWVTSDLAGPFKGGQGSGGW